MNWDEVARKHDAALPGLTLAERRAFAVHMDHAQREARDAGTDDDTLLDLIVLSSQAERAARES